MDWVSFFLINLLGIAFVGYFSMKADPEDNDTRLDEIMQNMPGLMVCLGLGFVNLIFVISNFEALDIFERVPWIVGVLGWAVLALMAFLPGDSKSDG